LYCNEQNRKENGDSPQLYIKEFVEINSIITWQNS